jgi:hypothetical protein
MQFNQTNKNRGNVNNAISGKGNVIQVVGDGNHVAPPKENFWATLWAKIKQLWTRIFG